MLLRKGKTKSILRSSVDSALLAVEIYNKPRGPFRVENYISLMIIAWTKLFHAYFNHEIGDKFYYKNQNGRYKKIDGERKAWELKTCILKYVKLSNLVNSNLEFFIRLRNKIEHRYIEKEELSVMIFGECQSLLYNFENFIVEFFGEEYSINESLAFSLQFSTLRPESKNRSSKQLLSKELKDIKKFIETYRNALSEEEFNSQEFSIKLIQIPKISNTNRNDVAIEFVRWDSLSDQDRKNYQKLDAIIKDKVSRKEVVNPGKHKASDVIRLIKNQTNQTFNHYDHRCVYFMLSVRPRRNEIHLDPFDTNAKYCHYDEVHNDYVYNDDWIHFITNRIMNGSLIREEWRKNYRNKLKVNIEDLEK